MHMLLLIFVAVWLSLPSSIIYSQTDPARAIGFKDFRLGMTRAAVEKIIRSGLWEHDPMFGSTMPKEPYEMYLKVEGIEVDVDLETGRAFYPVEDLDSAQRAMLAITCDGSGEQSQCTYLGFVKLMFLDDTLAAIYVSGIGNTLEQEDEARHWVTSAAADLTRRFGKAHDRDLLVQKLPRDSYGRLKPGIYEHSRWNLPAKRFGSQQSVAIWLNRAKPGGSLRVLTLSLVFEDRRRASLLYDRIWGTSNDH